jgi:hypothetical protein
MSELQPGQKGYRAQQREILRQEFQSHASIEGITVTISKRGRFRIQIPVFHCETAVLFSFSAEDARRFYRIGITVRDVRIAISAAPGSKYQAFFPTRISGFEEKTQEDEEIADFFNDFDNQIRSIREI